MTGAHCAACAAYESAVMQAAGRPVPPDVKPCPGFAMSDAFRQWLVEQMRREVMAQVSVAGLDRMAVVKAGKPAPGKGPSANGSAKQQPEEQRGGGGVE